MSYKICNKCNILKPVEDFYKKKSHSNSLFTECKICSNNRNKENYEKKRNNILLKKRATKRNVSLETIIEEDRIVNDANKIGKKYCYTCSSTLDKILFSKQSNTSDGLTTICKECRKKQSKDFYYKNVDKVINNKKEYFEKNKKKIIKYNGEYTKLRKENDPIFKLSINMRSRLKQYLKNKDFKRKITGSFFNIVGCTPNELGLHLESKFTEGMNWENHGTFGWHIDHIVPLSHAKSFNEVIELSHYSNLQPLWAIDNLKKGKKHVL
jgi:hypothetical protein